MKILVTGGTGYVGSAIVAALQRAGHDPIVFGRRPHPNATSIQGDIRDTRAVTRAAETAEAICHTAALVAMWRRDPSEFDAVNVGGLQSVLAAARALHTPRVVYTSSFLALPPSDSPHPLTANHYQRTKVAARDVARRATADGLPIVTLYPGVVYGPGPATDGNLVGRLMTDHLHGRLPGVIGGERQWSYTFVDDVAGAHVAALTHGRPRRDYMVGGVNAPQRAVFDFLVRARGVTPPRRIPYALATAAALVEEAKAAIFKRPPLLTRGVVEIFRHDWSMTSDAAISDLNLAVTPIAEGFERTLASLR
jgi:NAD+-dependent farnesol dehydrogenase